MMVNSLDLTTLITQIPHAQKLHNVQQIHPEMQQAVAQQMVLKKQQEEKKQIAKSESTASEAQVDKDGHHGAQQNAPRDAKHADAKPEAPEPDQGHLIDIQV